MGHNHDHAHHHHHGGHGSKNVAFAFFINLAFTIIEIIGGIMTNSVAILSDALHDLGDSFSLGLAWYLQKYSDKEKDEKFSYGYKRYSVLGALINSIILIGGSLFIIVEAIKRLNSPEAVDAKGMILFSVLGIVFNFIAYYKLHGSDNINEKVVSLHLLEDVLGWTVVLIGSILIYFFNIPILDPILSILVSLFILYNVLKNLNESISIIMQGKPHNIAIDEVEQTLLKTPGISSTHDLHVWTMDGMYNVLTAHIVVERDMNMNELHELKAEIKSRLNKIKIHHITVEFECIEEACSPKSLIQQ